MSAPVHQCADGNHHFRPREKRGLLVECDLGLQDHPNAFWEVAQCSRRPSMPKTRRGQPVLLALSATLSDCDRPKARDAASRFPEASRRDLGVDERKSFLARLGDRLPVHPSGEPARMLEWTGASLLVA